MSKRDLLPEEVERLIGKDAQRNNILAAKTVADIVKTTLGPRGMDKMLVSPTGEIVVTNDGVTILDEMQIEHPAAKMMVEIAKTQEKEVGDGTTSAVMIAGKLLENAERLLDQKIHATVIVNGYKLAQKKAQEILKSSALEITSDNEEVLKQIAMTAMTGKGAESSKEKFAEIVVQAVKMVSEKDLVDLEDIKIEKSLGEGVEDSELIKGIVMDKERISKDMPKRVENARIALIDFPLELRGLEIDAKISLRSPEELQGFVSQEEEMIREMVDKVISTGANVLFCQKGIDDFARYLLAREGVYTCRRISRSDLEKISKATKGRIISNLNELSLHDLGEAEIVEEVRKGADGFTYIRGCKNPKAVTILIHGGTSHVVDEIERAIKDGLGDVISTIETGLIVPGGGAIEIELAKGLREFGSSLSGRERLAVEEFANALEFIPLTLAENAGLDPIDVLTELKAKHSFGEKNFGLNLFTNKVENVLGARILEPFRVKSQAIDSATEVATMILRIDDVIASKPFRGKDSERKGFMEGLE